VEKYFSGLFDMDWRALEDFLVEFKIVGYTLKKELCKIHRDDIVLPGNTDYTLYDGNPRPDQQSPYHDCKPNPDHLLVNNSSFRAWQEESTINIFLLRNELRLADLFSQGHHVFTIGEGSSVTLPCDFYT
jgi:hypothetical protein